MKSDSDRIQEIFAQAMDRKSPVERENSLGEVCRSNESLHQSHRRRAKILPVNPVTKRINQ